MRPAAGRPQQARRTRRLGQGARAAAHSAAAGVSVRVDISPRWASPFQSAAQGTWYRWPSAARSAAVGTAQPSRQSPSKRFQSGARAMSIWRCASWAGSLVRALAEQVPAIEERFDRLVVAQPPARRAADPHAPGSRSARCRTRRIPAAPCGPTGSPGSRAASRHARLPIPVAEGAHAQPRSGPARRFAAPGRLLRLPGVIRGTQMLVLLRGICFTLMIIQLLAPAHDIRFGLLQDRVRIAIQRCGCRAQVEQRASLWRQTHLQTPARPAPAPGATPPAAYGRARFAHSAPVAPPSAAPGAVRLASSAAWRR